MSYDIRFSGEIRIDPPIPADEVHAGDIRLYKSTQSTGLGWLCDADAASAPQRGVSVVLVEEREQ